MLGVALVVALFSALFGGWAFMLLMGVLHSEVSRSIPAIGYAAAYPIALFATWTAAIVIPTSSGGGS